MKTFFRVLGLASPLRSYLIPYIFLAVLAVLFGVFNFSLLIPLLELLFGADMPDPGPAPELSFSIDYLVQSFKYRMHAIVELKGRKGALNFVCLVVLAMVFLTNVFRYLSQRILINLRSNLLFNLRANLISKILFLPVSYYSDRKKGDVMSLMSNDVHEIENSVVNSIQAVFREPLMITGFFILLFSLSLKLTLFTFLIVPIAGFLIGSITRRLRKQARNMHLYSAEMLSLTEEALTGLKVIKSYNAESALKRTFASKNSAYKKLIRSIMNKRELASPTSEFLGVAMAIGIVVYGGGMVLDSEGAFTAPEFITYLVVYSQVLSPIKGISTAMSHIQRGIASAERIFHLLDAPQKEQELENPLPLKEFNSGINFDNVSFSYGDADTLKNINCVLGRSKSVALVGPSGAGKSTLADLIPRFMDPQEGQITIDGISLKEYGLNDLRELIAIVTQEAFLFNGTVKENIAFGLQDIPNEKIIEAAKLAYAHDFIMEMPEGYNTIVGDSGGRLSGGQRQRISIARALLRNPKILILDEATSALDTASEKEVQKAIINLMRDRTSLVIAHRLSTVTHCDEILVMRKGEIIQRGNHLSLMEKDGLYKQLIEMQQL